MAQFLIGFGIGIYATGAIGTFLYVCIFCILSGNPRNIWRPFVAAAAWPIVVPLDIWHVLAIDHEHRRNKYGR